MDSIQLGSVSHGTLRNEHLIPAFLDVLADVDMARHDALRDEYGHVWDGFDYDDDNAFELCTALSDALGEYALPFTYFGLHPGDGSDFGFWLMDVDEIRDDPEVLVVADTADYFALIGADYPYVLHVNDHGNCTLYKTGTEQVQHVTARTLTQVWSVV